jgi:putative CocE/NonD family hydrolase
MVPYGDDFADIDIPVLSITGYYDDGQISAVRYFKEHYRHRTDAEHYLLIGPYDHFGSQQSFKPTELRGYPIDPVAQFDTSEITFAWFDHVFRGEPRPAILKDRVNFEVMGANVWRHAPSVTAMSEMTQRFFLNDIVLDGRYVLSKQPAKAIGAISQKVNFADRTANSAGYYPFPILNTEPDLSAGLVFASEPLAQAVEVSGGFSGELHVRTNKRDFDFMVALYELRADGSTFALSYYVGRASYADDITTRRLLDPGVANIISFDRTRLVSRQVAAGSQLLLVVDVIKNNFHEINYGTGGTVSEESIADASVPLMVDWLTASSIRVPMTHIPEVSTAQ